MSKKKVHKKASKVSPVKNRDLAASTSRWNNKTFSLIIFFVAFGLYANTLGHGYTQDDAIVITENMFTQDGVSGIPGILTKDTFFGFFKEEGKDKLVSGGRYRPFTLTMFAIENQIFGNNPFFGHLINILLYGLLGVCIYRLLIILLIGKSKDQKTNWKKGIAFLIALLYITHPIHTEAVANIKGRDEIMTMLGSVIALWMAFKYYYSGIFKYLVFSGVAFFVALMSKENAITFLAIVPIAFLLFAKKGKKQMTIGKSIKMLMPFAISTFIFLVIRFSVLGFDFGGTPNELMNNPFLKIEGNRYVDYTAGEKFASITYSLGKYLSLLIFPHPLCHDYYPKTIEMVGFGDMKVLTSLLFYLILIGLSIFLFRKNKLISFGILFYLITLSIVSNIVFPIGTNMSERFMFMPSLGYAILFVGFFDRFMKDKKQIVSLCVIVALAYSFKTITRNVVWKNDFTLFTTDVKNNLRSAKLLNAAGGALSTEASKMKDGAQKTQYLNEAIGYLNKAVEIHPTYRNAYLLLGNSHFWLDQYDMSIKYLDQALSFDPNFKDALKNLPIVLREGGRHKGQKENDLKTAESWLLRSYQLNPKDYETCRLLGITYGIGGNHQKAVKHFQEAINLKPDVPENYVSMGTAYQQMGDAETARGFYEKAVELDPQALNKLRKQ